MTFTTIIPEWYEDQPRHLRRPVRSKYSEASSTSDGSNTTQIFLSQTILDYIYTNVSPYNTKGKDTTTNASDRVCTQQTEGETLVVLTGITRTGTRRRLRLTCRSPAYKGIVTDKPIIIL